MKKRTVMMMLAAIGLLVGSASATLLDFNVDATFAETFEHGGSVTGNGAWNPDSHTAYGSRVATNGSLEVTLASTDDYWWRQSPNTYAAETGEGYTPNIATTYDQESLEFLDGGWKGVTNAARHKIEDAGKLIGFKPDAGYAVKIHSFVMESWSWASNSLYLDAVEICRESDDGVVWTAPTDTNGFVGVESSTTTTFTPNFTGISGEEYYINLVKYTSPTRSFAIDDILISQALAVVPPPTIISLKPFASNVVEMVVDCPIPVTSRPLTKSDLVDEGSWSAVAHSTNGFAPFYETNLSYSVASGSNLVIYLEATNSAAFFGIGEE